jgi:hypothetical protein
VVLLRQLRVESDKHLKLGLTQPFAENRCLRFNEQVEDFVT